MAVRKADNPDVRPAPLAPAGPKPTNAVLPAPVEAQATPPTKGWGPPSPNGQAPKRDGFVQGRPTPFTLPTQGEWALDSRGQVMDPVTLYVHGDLKDIEQAFEKTGWSKANVNNTQNNREYVRAAVGEEGFKATQYLADTEKKLGGPALPTLKDPFTGEVNKMPVSPQTLRGRPHVMAFERNNNPLGGRDHFRIFDTGLKDPAGKPVYAIAATRDARIEVNKQHPETGFLFHAPETDVRGERDAVLGSLQAAGLSLDVKKHPLTWPGQAVNGTQVPDGTAFDVTLR